MTTSFHSYIAGQLASQLKQRRIVVWYDARTEFEPFVAELLHGAGGNDPVVVDVAGTSATVVVAEGSLYAARLRIEPVVGTDDPTPTVLYVPGVKRSHHGSVLMELETAGTRWEPQLRQLARIALRQRFTDGVIDELLARESTTYSDIATALETDGHAPPSVLKSLLQGGTADAQLASWIAAESIDVQVVAKEGTAELRKLVASRLGITLEGDDLSKWRRIVARIALGLEFRSDLRGSPPAELAALPASTADIDRNTRGICAALRANHPDAYLALADRAESELKLHEGSIDPLALGSIDTFRFEERVLLRRCGELVRDGTYGQVLEITEQRAGSYWLTNSVERQAQWEAIRYAAELGAAADLVDGGLTGPPRSVADWIDRYASTWYVLDGAQRRLEAWLPKLEDDPDDIAITAVRNRYDATLEKLAVGYSKALQAANWDVDGVLHQTSVFDTLVKPSQGRVAFFLVDAMRYEMGDELAARLRGQGEVVLRPAVGVLPSITTMGMAALMPGASQSYDVVDDNGKLVARVDGNLLGDLKARKKHLAARVPSSIDLELGDLLSMTRKNLEKKLAAIDLVVIRSQDIDLFGESESTFHARTVMNTVIDNLAQAVRKLASVGVERAVIASDHGHIYASREREEAMRIEAPGGAAVELHRRCWIGRGGATPAATVRVSATSLGNATDLDFVFPVGSGVFKAGGGLAFHHGGTSLQESVIPVITVRSKTVAESAGAGAPGLEVLGVPSAVTNRIFSVKVRFGTMEPPPVRPVLISEGREVGTVGMAVGADLDRTSGVVALATGAEATIGFVLDDDSIDSVRVVIVDPTSDAELYRSPNDIPVRLGVA